MLGISRPLPDLLLSIYLIKLDDVLPPTHFSVANSLLPTRPDPASLLHDRMTSAAPPFPRYWGAALAGPEFRAYVSEVRELFFLIDSLLSLQESPFL